MAPVMTEEQEPQTRGRDEAKAVAGEVESHCEDVYRNIMYEYSGRHEAQLICEILF